MQLQKVIIEVDYLFYGNWAGSIVYIVEASFNYNI